MCKNCPLEDDAIARLEPDPRIADSAEIAVAGDGGVVTLRGTVERFSATRGTRDARVCGAIYEVINHLKVNLLGADRREDDEIRGAALQNLTWDAEVPSDSIDVNVQDGWVTLKGDVSFQFQSDAAYDDVSRLYGVAGVTNEIRVQPRNDPNASPALRQRDQSQRDLELARPLLDRMREEFLRRRDPVGDRVLVNAQAPRRARRTHVLLEIDTARGAAERIARPREPPTCCVVFSRSHASPESPGATPVVPAIVTGTIDIPMPAPRIIAGTTWLA